MQLSQLHSSKLELSIGLWPGGWGSSSAELRSACWKHRYISQLHVLPGTITTGHQVPRVGDIVSFATFIYPWWITCASATDAHGLTLACFISYGHKVVNLFKCNEALKHHIWYLTGLEEYA